MGSASASKALATGADDHPEIRQVARQYLDGNEVTEGLLNHIEVAIRCFDPCLSCATHALGQMPLEVTLVDADGKVLDHKMRNDAACCT